MQQMPQYPGESYIKDLVLNIYDFRKEEFMKMLQDAARDAGVSLRLIEVRGASFDHPVMPAIPETEYLKFVLLQIV